MKTGVETRFKCVVCGKITAGRIPKNGDLSERYPRRHIKNGKPCPGNIIQAEWLSNRINTQSKKP